MSKKNPHPPRWAFRLLKFFCPDEHLEIILGDLQELFEHRLINRGYFLARLFYIKDVFDTMRPFVFKKKIRRQRMNGFDLFKSNLKLSARNIWRDKSYSFINVLGLAIAMTAAFAIFLYTSYESGYDSFLNNSENIYRVNTDEFSRGNLIKSSAESYPGLAPALSTAIAGVENTARLYNSGSKNNIVVSYEEGASPIRLSQDRLLYAEASFLEMFEYEFVQGNPAGALSKPLTAVLSASMAEKYFGDQPAIGEILHLKDDDFHDEKAVVTGVFKDIPGNTHLQFEILFSYQTLLSRSPDQNTWFDQSWRRPEVYTYVSLIPGSQFERIEEQLSSVLVDHSTGLKDADRSASLTLQPIQKIHLHSERTSEASPAGDADSISVLKIIGIGILIISWLNFINLSTARSLKRAREVGVRKSLGAVKGQLIRQFLFESGLINALAIVFSIVLLYLLLPVFVNAYALKKDILDFLNPQFYTTVFFLWLSATFISGLYPAHILSTFKPSVVLRGTSKQPGTSGFLRKSLVTFQFTLCICLIGSTFIIDDQMEAIINADLGVNIDQVLVVKRPGDRGQSRSDYSKSVKLFFAELDKNSNILGYSNSGLLPGKTRNNRLDIQLDDQPDVKLSVRAGSVDEGFVALFDLNLLAGNGFQKRLFNDSLVLINEAAAIRLGFQNSHEAIGKGMTIGTGGFSWRGHIAGVVKDFHQESLKKSKGPALIGYTADGGEYFSVKINKSNLSDGVVETQEAWSKAFPGNPFQYFFLDDYFNQQYQGDLTTKSLLSLFSVIALLLGGLGLVGLSVFVSQQRSKEMGIRKILGSSTTGLFLLLNKDFLKPIMISSVVAIPVVILLMNEWLANFTVSTRIDPLMILKALLLVFGVGLVTVSYQSIKSSKVNPIESLRNE